MELLQLRYFFESAKNESFARTAEKYMVPVASVSASIKRLEKELGCELFYRTANRVFLNDQGKSFRDSVAVAFEEIDRAVEKLTAVTTDNRTIRILVRCMRAAITDYVVEYKQRHPHIPFNMSFNFDHQDSNHYDIIIDEEKEQHKEFEYFSLHTTKIQLRVAAASSLCGKKLTLKQLADQPFISIGENNGMHEIFSNACQRAGFTPKVIVQCNDLQCNRKFVEANIGIGIDRAYPWGEPLDGLSVLDVIDFDESQTVCCYYKKQSEYGNVAHFLEFLKTKIA